MKNLFHREAVAHLLAWYRENKRDLPWRRTRDPYRIWVSEIMLQQTRVEAVKPYYAKFLETCPTVKDLADLPEDTLMKLWEGLGYYSRARNLQKAAKAVMEQYGGQLPRSYGELRALCGIGDYTAGAIASIAYNIRVPAVDGNVMRALARLQGSREDIASIPVKKAWSERLAAVIPEEAGDFNQALIELGATVCVPSGEARCGECPMCPYCIAFREHLTEAIPVRTAKKPRRVERLTVLLICDGDRTALRKRPEKGLLAGLFELPNLPEHLDEAQVTAFVRSIGLEPIRLARLADSKHIFTHVEWHMIGYRVTVTSEFDDFCRGDGLLLVKNSDLHARYAVPSAFAAYTERNE